MIKFFCNECGKQIWDLLSKEQKRENTTIDELEERSSICSDCLLIEARRTSKLNNIPPNKVMISYATYGLLLSKLVEKIKTFGVEFSHVYGISRGGLPIAVHLSHSLGIKFLESNWHEWEIDNNSFILVVDDVNDTGRTLKETVELFNHFKIKSTTAVLYNKPWSLHSVGISVEYTKDWIIFPWERSDEIPNRSGY